MRLPEITRRPTRGVMAGKLAIGGDAPVSIQSMTNTPTWDVDATLAQIDALAEAGAQLVRVAVPTAKDTAALKKIVSRSPVPVAADVHFHFDRAIESIDAGVAKIRLNPGNISDRKQVRQVIRAAASGKVAIRVGVNEGSVVERVDGEKMKADLNLPLDELMEVKLAEYLDVFEEEGFANLVLSAKSHDAFTCVAVYRRLADRWNYPLHLGVTHAGTVQTGAVRSAAALGALLSEGIGDTVRISFAGDPVQEVLAADELLASLRLRSRHGIELIACPTCGRLQTDVAPVVEQVRLQLANVRKHITVAIMGCVVNGPGEAQSADVALCAGKGKAVIYRRGRKIRTVAADAMIAAVVDEVRSLDAELSS